MKHSKTERNNPYQLTELAIEKDEFDKLLLGESPYECLNNPFLKGYGKTDLFYVYKFGLCKYSASNPEFDMKRYIEGHIPNLCKSPKGIEAVSTILLAEYIRQEKPKLTAIGLDTDVIAQELKEAVRSHQEELREYRIEAGYGKPEGLLSDLRRVSRNLKNLGGPSFVDI